jgi:hypothetical protein
MMSKSENIKVFSFKLEFERRKNQAFRDFEFVYFFTQILIFPT